MPGVRWGGAEGGGEGVESRGCVGGSWDVGLEEENQEGATKGVDQRGRKVGGEGVESRGCVGGIVGGGVGGVELGG